MKITSGSDPRAIPAPRAAARRGRARRAACSPRTPRCRQRHRGARTVRRGDRAPASAPAGSPAASARGRLRAARRRPSAGRCRSALAAAAMALVVALPRAWPGAPRRGDARRRGRRSHQGAASRRSPSIAAPRRAARRSPTAASRARAISCGRLHAARARAYGVILSIDGRGGVTLHLPSDGERAAPLDVRRAPRSSTRRTSWTTRRGGSGSIS